MSGRPSVPVHDLVEEVERLREVNAALLEAATDTVRRHDRFLPADERTIDLVASLRAAIAKAEGAS